MAQTVFERYGGFSTFSKVVSAFYDKILDSPVTSPYFANVDMRRLIDHQTKFVASVVGGPASYTNEHLARIHTPFKINEAAFSEMSTLLRETLEDFGVAEADIQVVLREILNRKHFVVTG
ncbi:MAG: group 1 truncated hemoglobin [Pseudolabrys sp.]|nr:group 1 truncated hemoglobin [Pseudolabrys sp.]MBV9954147.1 group 1 truncated hemoglobin [Pseudolabrys sp.]